MNLTPGNAGRFDFLDVDAFDPVLIREILAERLGGFIVRGFASNTECVNTLEYLQSHPDTRLRTGDATGKYLGTFHWGKNLSEYFSECRRMRQVIAEAIPENHPWARFLTELTAYAKREGLMVRSAKWGADESIAPLIRSWAGTNGYALIPHEDIAQCSQPAQQGFEIQEVKNAVASANLCIANDSGGELVLWDVIPDSSMRRRFDTMYDGGPYPAEFLRVFNYKSIEISAGDLYVFNGAHIHAVSAAKGERATVSALMGEVKNGDIAIWT